MADPKQNKTAIKLLSIKPTEYSVTQTPLLVLIEAKETYDYLERELFEAKLVISYRVIDKVNTSESSSFDAHYCYNFADGDVAITGTLVNRAVCLDPPSIRGNHIGTYIMNAVVAWAKQWPAADVCRIRLSANQAGNDIRSNHKVRRNTFYEQFGITFDYSDLQKESGYSIPMKAEKLINVEAY